MNIISICSVIFHLLFFYHIPFFACIKLEQINTARITPERDTIKNLGNAYMQQAFKLKRTQTNQLPKLTTVHSNPRMRLPSTAPYQTTPICTRVIPKSEVFSMPQTGPLQLQGTQIPLVLARTDLSKTSLSHTYVFEQRASSPKSRMKR